MYFKKAISSVVAVSLLLVVSVLSVTLFQNWNSSFLSLTTLKVSESSNFKVEVDQIFGNMIYLKNSNDVDIYVDSILIGNKSCLIDKKISPGISKTSLNLCTLGLVKDVYEVIVSSNVGLSSKFLNVEGVGYPSLKSVGRFPVPNSYVVEINDGTAYVSDYSRIYALDISDPYNISSYGQFGWGSVRGLTIKDDVLYRTEHYVSGDFESYNVSDPSSITLLGTTDVGVNEQDGVFVDDRGLAYLAQTNGFYIYIFNVSDPTNLSYIKYHDTSSSYDVFVDNDVVYNVGPTVSTFWNVSDIYNMNLLGSSIGSYNAQVVDGFLYLTINDKFSIVDVSDKSNIVTVNDYVNSTLFSNTYDVKVEGIFAFISDTGSGKLHVMDISDKTNIKHLESFSGYPLIKDISVKLPYIYVTGNHSLSIIEFS